MAWIMDSDVGFPVYRAGMEAADANKTLGAG